MICARVRFEIDRASAAVMQPKHHAVHHSAVLVLGAFHICMQSWFNWCMCACHMCIDFALFPNRHQVVDLLCLFILSYREQNCSTHKMCGQANPNKKAVVIPPLSLHSTTIIAHSKKFMPNICNHWARHKLWASKCAREMCRLGWGRECNQAYSVYARFGPFVILKYSISKRFHSFRISIWWQQHQ